MIARTLSRCLVVLALLGVSMGAAGCRNFFESHLEEGSSPGRILGVSAAEIEMERSAPHTGFTRKDESKETETLRALGYIGD